MMQQMAEQAPHQDQAPGKGGQADNPCKQDLACHVAAVTIAAPTQGMGNVTLTTATVDHRLGDPLAAPSRPPDRSLRPPIHL